jgi:hypothetical protein
MSPSTEPTTYTPADDDDLILEEWMEEDDDVELELLEFDEG